MLRITYTHFMWNRRQHGGINVKWPCLLISTWILNTTFVYSPETKYIMSIQWWWCSVFRSSCKLFLQLKFNWVNRIHLIAMWLIAYLRTALLFKAYCNLRDESWSMIKVRWGGVTEKYSTYFVTCFCSSFMDIFTFFLYLVCWNIATTFRHTIDMTLFVTYLT